ncbi:MAG: CDGSH iron-sulfur domain-containing protein [Planctomycetota bacterium]|nr:CDGSH iron-sulfur domain-containing protein [Planctomycetota bacterium]
MPRLIRFDSVRPIKIDPANFPRDEQGNLKPIWICACGLSQNMPFCDQSHKQCATTEQPGKLYVYDPQRRGIVEERPDA